MRILALETNIGKIKSHYLTEGESEILTTHYHGASFFFASIREVLYTILLFSIGITAWLMNAPMGFVVTMLGIIWIIFVLSTLFKAYVDWMFDFIFVTTDRVVLIDQTSIIRQNIKPIHMENIGGVSSQTQLLDIFRFGIIDLDLKEGEGGGTLRLKYVPNAKEVAATISELVTQYQRRNISSGRIENPL